MGSGNFLLTFHEPHKIIDISLTIVVSVSPPNQVYTGLQGTSTRGQEKRQYIIYTHHPSHLTQTSNLMTKRSTRCSPLTFQARATIGGWFPGKHDGLNMWQWYCEVIIAVRDGQVKYFPVPCKTPSLPGKSFWTMYGKVSLHRLECGKVCYWVISLENLTPLLF